MTLDELKILIQQKTTDDLISVLDTHRVIKSVEDAIKQFDPKQHIVFDKAKRKDKFIKNAEGQITETVPVSRIPLAIQKKIVLTAVAFIGTPTLTATPGADQKAKDFIAIQRKIWFDNKIDYRFRTIAKKTKSEKQAAELWYTVNPESGYWKGHPIRTDAKYKFRMKVLAKSLGDDLYPVFDEFGDMIAFGRAYETMDKDGKNVKYFDLYTAERFYFNRQENGQWASLNESGTEYVPGYQGGLASVFGKIPVIYYSQPLTEWADVQELVERLETIISNHADTNDYFGSPIVVASGKVEGFATKGETGKLLQAENGATVEYLTYDFLPESVKLEMDNLKMYIHSLTSTPDISFENLKNLGYFSTVALKTMFIDAHLKAYDSEEIFGEGVQRRINYLKTAIAKIDTSFAPVLPLEIKPIFEYFLPTNVQEIIQTLVSAVSGGIMTADTAVQQNPLVSDADAEIVALKGTAKPASGDPGPQDPPPNDGGLNDKLEKILFDLQQLKLAADRAEKNGTTVPARLNRRLNELLKTI